MKFTTQIHVEIPDSVLPGLLKTSGVTFKGEADAVMGLTMLAATAVAPALRALLLDPERSDSAFGTAYALTTDGSSIQIAITLGKPDGAVIPKKPAKAAAKKTTARKRTTPAKGGQPR